MSSVLNRRTFLRGTAAMGMAGLGGAAAGGQRQVRRTDPPPRRGPNEEIHTAILGIRSQGRHHIAYHQASPNIRIVTLCDPDERLFADRVGLVTGGQPKTEVDLRRVLDDPDVECVSIAMPNHWHALATIWACQAGKDVYVEKPMTHFIDEGRMMIAAAKRYGRVVQVGTQYRSNKGCQAAINAMRDGVIGEVYMAEALMRRVRQSIGGEDDGPVPEGVNYDLWCGPAPRHAYNPNRFHYQWHWFWDYGNGEIGNNGPHVVDLAMQGLGKQDALPVEIDGQGGRFVWNDQGETPNMHMSQYRYSDGKVLRLDVRNLPTPAAAGAKSCALFYGSKGHLTLHLNGNFETVVDGEPGPTGSGKGMHPEHVANFYDVVRSRKMSDLLAPTEYGHTGAALCHLGNISYRLGRSVAFDPDSQTFGKDKEANAFLKIPYRAPYNLPDGV